MTWKVHTGFLLELWLASSAIRELRGREPVSQEVCPETARKFCACIQLSFRGRCPPKNEIDASEDPSLYDEAQIPGSPILKEASMNLPSVGV